MFKHNNNHKKRILLYNRNYNNYINQLNIVNYKVQQEVQIAEKKYYKLDS